MAIKRGTATPTALKRGGLNVNKVYRGTVEVWNPGVVGPPAGAIAYDRFTRTVASGFGTAEIGGAWTSTAGASSVIDGVAKSTITIAGGGAGGRLPGISTDDGILTLVASGNKLGVGSGWFQLFRPRIVPNATQDEYRLKMNVSSTGVITAWFAKAISGQETQLGSVVTVPITYLAGMRLSVRVSAIGLNPTRLQSKIWIQGDVEPGPFLHDFTDSSATLQAPGHIGFHTQLGSNATNVPFEFTYDDVTVMGSTIVVVPNEPPVAAFSHTTNGMAVSFDASGSTDPDGTVASHVWDFGDGTSGSGAITSHTYSEANTFPVTLTVADNKGLVDSITYDVTTTWPAPTIRESTRVDVGTDSDGTRAWTRHADSAPGLVHGAIMYMTTGGNVDAVTPPSAVTAPAGFQLVAGPVRNVETTTDREREVWMWVGRHEDIPASGNFTVTSPTSNASSRLTTFIIDNVIEEGTPFGTTATAAPPGHRTSWTAPSIVTQVDNSMRLTAWATNTAISAPTTNPEETLVSGPSAPFTTHRTIPTAGATGTTVLTGTTTTTARPSVIVTEIKGRPSGSQLPDSGGETPTQAPLLSLVSFTNASDDIRTSGIQDEQESHLRGVRQNTMTIVGNANIPAKGQLYTPSRGALKVVNKPFHTANDFQITATAAATATATTLTVSSADAAAVFVGEFLFASTGEILYITAKSGNNLTVQRNRQGSVGGAQAITVGMKFTVPTGHVNNSGGTYASSRVEGMFNHPSPWNQPASAWIHRPGTIRYTRFRICLAESFNDQNGTLWISAYQWKGQHSGSPSIGLDVKNGSFLLGGTLGHTGGANNLGSTSKGSWVEFVFGFLWSNSASGGWVKVWRNGSVIIPQRTQATMNTANGVADLIYDKVGIYRTKAHTTDHEAWYSDIATADNETSIFAASL